MSGPPAPERSSTAANHFARFTIVIALVVSIISVATAQTAPPWRYDLRKGDHLIYRYTFQRRTQSGKNQRDEEQAQIEARFRTHVLVAADNAEGITLGFQRNRESAELTEYRSKGKDRLAREQIAFNQRLQKRPARFSEAMDISPSGKPRYAWEMARETSSHLLADFHEVINLPPLPLSKGEPWRGSTLLGLDFRWLEDESVHGKLCHHIEGTLPDKSVKMSYWWSPESGVLEQLTLDGTYSSGGGQTHEKARMELETRRRGEPMDTWLASPETRLGALQAILLSPQLPVSAEQLSPVLNSPTINSSDPAAQALALAIASQRQMQISPETLQRLQQSASAEVQTEGRTLIRLLLDPSSRSATSTAPADQCHRPLPLKPPLTKFGTVFDVAPDQRNNSQIPYLIRVPLTYRENRPSPLLIYLSGGAGFAIDGVNSADDVVSQTDYLVLYPQAADLWWKPEVARRFELVLDDVFERYNVDRDRIHLTGFSNGGTGSLYFATLWPQRFAAVVSLMGAGLCNEKVKAGLPNLENIPLLFVHGADDPVITPDCSTTTHATFADLHSPIQPELKILPNREHDITLLSDDGLTLAFFKDKFRNPFPQEVKLIVSDALAARAYWIEILDGEPGKSSLEARVKPDGAIEIHSHDVKSVRLHLRPELLSNPGDIRILWNGKKMSLPPLRNLCALPAPPSAEDPKLDLTDVRDLTLP